MKIQIKHKHRDIVLFEIEAPSQSEKSLMGYALEKAVAEGVNLAGAYLINCNLSNLSLKGAKLSSSILKGSDFSNSILTDSDMGESDLSGANFKNTDLSNVYLYSTILTNTNLQGAFFKDKRENRFEFSTPEEAIAILDKIRTVVLNTEDRLDMSDWHSASSKVDNSRGYIYNNWKGKTPEAEMECGTAHCLAGWLQVCSTNKLIRDQSAQFAGIISAPAASNMFFKTEDEVLQWLKSRAYVEESKTY